MLNIDPQHMAGSGKKERLRQDVPLFKKKKGKKKGGKETKLRRG